MRGSGGFMGGALAVMALVAALAPGRMIGAEAPADPTGQGVLSQEQIEQSLRPARTRSFPSRGLARRSDTDATASTAGQAAPAAINLNIPFEYNSSTLKAEGAAQLVQLQRALNSDALHAERFLVAGHTDGKGSAAFNKKLSLRRAEAVREFLVSHGVEASRLETVGYGAEQLLLPDRPVDAQNRRVEIRDLGAVP